MTPAQLVQNVLVGTGVTVSNITYTGSANSIGAFTTGATPTNLGLTSGIIMSTGFVNGANATSIPPAIGCAATNFESSISSSASDPDLQALVSSTISDACVLQFDFLPLSDTIKFRYVFASEEYPEFVCSTFNDVFGFFVTGANPAGGNYTAKNIALIPGTALPVAINTVNTGTNSGSDPSCVLLYSMYYVNNTGGTSIVFDGFTTVLTAWCKVIPCTPYHIKLAIGDAGDESYDSGVFLEANSFSTSAVTMQTHFTSPLASTTDAIEGCNDAIITFSLSDLATSPYVINYTIGGTATNGVDYTNVPNSVTIPTGQDSVNLIIHPILDGIPEGVETVQLVFQTSICGASDTLSINILNNDPFTVTSSNDTSICGGSANIAVYPSGGISPCTYLWNNGAGTNPTAVVSPPTTTTYNVTVTDVCGSTASQSVVVSVGQSNADAGPNVSICAGQTTTLNAGGGAAYIWSTTQTTPSILVGPMTTTTYYVTATGLCPSSDSIVVTVNPLPIITATASPSSIIMTQSSTICATGGSTYSWTSVPTDITLAGQTTNTCPVVTPGLTTIYMVTGTDTNGCVGFDTALVTVIPVLPIVNFYGYPLSGCEPLTVQFQDSSIKTLPSSTYYWEFGNNTYSYDQNPIAYYDHAGTYDVTETVTNPGGFSSQLTKTNYVTVYPLPVAIFSSVPTVAQAYDPNFSFYDYSLGYPTHWYWNFGDGTYDTVQNPFHSYSDSSIYYNFNFMQDTGAYHVTLIVTTTYGCIDSMSETVWVAPSFGIYVPNAFTPNDDPSNQEFCASGYGILDENYSIHIYNRVGQLIYTNNVWGECWDGTISGVDAAEGVYIYIIKFMDLEHIVHHVRGVVTLYR